MNNPSENIISNINTNVFFSEFVYAKNEFCTPDKNELKELADCVVSLDDIFMIYQIKDRNINNAENLEGNIKWFKKTVLNEAVKQIKDTIDFFEKYDSIEVFNNRNLKIDISKQFTSSLNIKKIIIYNPSPNFTDELRFIKHHLSRNSGFIHLFHVEDYTLICSYLLTPTEVNEYLQFRENLILKHTEKIKTLPEQYILGHFFKTLDTDVINLENLNLNKWNEHLFDCSFIIENFAKHTDINKNKNAINYYPIIKEIIKLNREELKIFKEMYFWTIDNCISNIRITPSRFVVPRTNCGFIFMPIQSKYTQTDYEGFIKMLMLLHKYDQKLEKCIGMISFPYPNEEKSINEFWSFTEFKWEYNFAKEQAVNVSILLRPLKSTF